MPALQLRSTQHACRGGPSGFPLQMPTFSEMAAVVLKRCRRETIMIIKIATAISTIITIAILHTILLKHVSNGIRL